MPFRKLVGSYKSYDLPTHVIEAGYLAVDVNTGDLRIGDGSTAGGTLLASGIFEGLIFFSAKKSRDIGKNKMKKEKLFFNFIA